MDEKQRYSDDVDQMSPDAEVWAKEASTRLLEEAVVHMAEVTGNPYVSRTVFTVSIAPIIISSVIAAVITAVKEMSPTGSNDLFNAVTPKYIDGITAQFERGKFPEE